MLKEADSPLPSNLFIGQIDCSGRGKKTCAKYLPSGKSMMYAEFENGKLIEKRFGGIIELATKMEKKN